MPWFGSALVQTLGARRRDASPQNNTAAATTTASPGAAGRQAQNVTSGATAATQGSPAPSTTAAPTRTPYVRQPAPPLTQHQIDNGMTQARWNEIWEQLETTREQAHNAGVASRPGQTGGTQSRPAPAPVTPPTGGTAWTGKPDKEKEKEKPVAAYLRPTIRPEEGGEFLTGVRTRDEVDPLTGATRRYQSGANWDYDDDGNATATRTNMVNLMPLAGSQAAMGGSLAGIGSIMGAAGRAGGWRGTGGGGVSGAGRSYAGGGTIFDSSGRAIDMTGSTVPAGGGSTHSFDAAANATAQNQDLIKRLLLDGGMPGITSRFTGSEIGQRMARMAENPTGMDPEELAAQRRSVDEGSAALSASMGKDLANRLAAGGHMEGPAGAFAQSQLQAQLSRDQVGRHDGVTMADADLKRQTQKQASDYVLSLLGMETGAISDAANQIGAFQFPFLPPDYAGGGGGSGGGWSGTGGGGSAPVGAGYNPATGGPALQVDPRTGLLPGAMVTIGAAPSAAQMRMLQGNHKWRAETGQDVNRLWDGRVFHGFG